MGLQFHKAIERLKYLASLSHDDAIKAMMDERTNVPKQWCDTCQHNTTYTVNGIGMWICDLCRCDNTPKQLNIPSRFV